MYWIKSKLLVMLDGMLASVGLVRMSYYDYMFDKWIEAESKRIPHVCNTTEDGEDLFI